MVAPALRACEGMPAARATRQTAPAQGAATTRIRAAILGGAATQRWRWAGALNGWRAFFHRLSVHRRMRVEERGLDLRRLARRRERLALETSDEEPQPQSDERDGRRQVEPVRRGAGLVVRGLDLPV